MLHQHLFRIPDGRQVVGPVPALHLREVAQQLFLLIRTGLQAQGLACLFQPLGSGELEFDGTHAAFLREP
ncbi:Uncharacterised protein [Bordetella trematum]|nr:Uncharacterised protein [Bordetella trematum]